jgi:hypothetical protein
MRRLMCALMCARNGTVAEAVRSFRFSLPAPTGCSLPKLRSGIQQGRDFNRQADLGFADSHAAAIKHTVTRVEKTMGVVKAYLQLKAVTATKQMASAHAMLRTRAKVSAGSPPSSHANTAANKRNTEKKSPNALKKSQ